MKRLLKIALLGPFLVCNPQGADYFVVTGLPAIIDGSHIPPDSSGKYAFKLDLANLPPGNYTVKARACVETSEIVAGGCSDESLPFDFTRPQLSVPAGPKLVK